MNSVNLRRKLKRHRRVPYEEPVPSTLRCARCEGPAEGALQHILCGCRFCAQPCAAELEGRVCLGGTSECAIVTADQLLPDRGARRELGDLKVRCDHCNGIFFRRQWSRHNEECKAQELATLRKKIEEGKEQSMADQLQLLLTYTQMTAIPTEKWSSPKSGKSDPKWFQFERSRIVWLNRENTLKFFLALMEHIERDKIHNFMIKRYLLMLSWTSRQKKIKAKTKSATVRSIL